MATALRRALLIGRVCLLAFLLLLLILPLLGASQSALVGATAQEARDARLTKDALILSARQAAQPAEEHALALSELQDGLPLWQAEQAALARYPDGQVQLLVLQSNADYTPMTAALKVILAEAGGTIDPVQVTIVLAHEHSYAATLAQITTLMQADTVAHIWQYVISELVTLALLIGATIIGRRIP